MNPQTWIFLKSLQLQQALHKENEVFVGDWTFLWDYATRKKIFLLRFPEA